jgi:hypothetical protein
MYMYTRIVATLTHTQIGCLSLSQISFEVMDVLKPKLKKYFNFSEDRIKIC